MNSINIWYETFGKSNHVPILLIMGAGSQGLLWTDDFCNRLANHNFYVIRYDHRDTGLSTCVDYEKHPYTLKDLANDALGLLDKLRLPKAHVIGLSMGGYIAQLLEIDHPERLISVTIMMSTPNHMVFMNALVGNNMYISDLPKPKDEVITFFSKPPRDLNSKKKTIDYSLATWKLLNGPQAPFDEAYWRSLIIKHYDRIQNHIAQYNHGKACFASPEDRTPLLKNVNIPTLVIHGTEDPLLPVEHGRVLAKTIPNAKLVIIEGMGHALNPVFQQGIIEAFLKHIEKKN